METYTLKNGLKLCFNQDKKKHSTLFELCIKYGGNYNKFNYDGVNYKVNDGMAHLIEHLLIEKSMYGNLLDIWTNHHMETNGETYDNKIIFYVNTVDDYDFALESLLLGINTKSFNEKDLEITKKPVLREVTMSEDSGSDFLWTHINRNSNNERLFENITGTSEYVKKFTFQEVNNCIDAFFNPSNEILIVSGNFDKDKIIKRVEDIYSLIDFTNKKLIIPAYNENLFFKQDELELQYAYKDMTEVVYHFKMYLNKETPNIQDIINKIEMKFELTYGLGSKFDSILRNKGLIDSPYSIYTSYSDNILNVYLTDVKTKNAKLLNKYVNEYLDLTQFNEEQFELYKRKMQFNSLLEKSLFDQSKDYLDNLLLFDKETDESDYSNIQYNDLKNFEVDTNHKCLIKLRDN